MNLLASRLRPPQPLFELVLREHLLSRLSASAAPLVAVSAPAGSGKTVALSQWAASDQRQFAWLQADAADNDPLIFLSYLVAALRGVTRIDPAVAQWLHLAPPPVATQILPALAAAICEAEPFVLVVDDAHLMTNEACWQVVGVLLDEVPQGAQLCLSGRSSPPLPLERLRAARRLCEFGPTELALDREEIRQLLLLHGVAADVDTVACLEHITEGWAAGLSLAALAGPTESTAEWFAGIRGHQHHIARYLASEVLAQQTPEMTRFLLQTSILERLCTGLCRAVTGDEQAGDLLRAVARRNLFISALDDNDEWFRYHHLMAEFLQTELARHDETGVAALHGRAAAWFEAHDELEEAVRHWLAAGEAGRAGRIVCRAFMDYRRLARYETINRWLHMFTDEQILDDEALTLAAGWIAPMTGESSRGRRWISAAFRAVIGDGLWPGSRIPLRAVQAGMIAGLAPEGVTQMRENAELAAALSVGVPLSESTTVAMLLGVARWLCGEDTEDALRVLREAESEGSAGNVIAQICAAATAALILADAGRWAEASKRTAAGMRRFEEAGLTWGGPVIPLLVARTRVRAHEGRPGLAEGSATISAIIAEGHVPPLLALTSEAMVGELHVEDDDLAEAARWMRSGFARLALMPDAGILRPRLFRLRYLIERRWLIEPLTPAERRALDLLPTELSLKEIASRLGVSPETVHTHVKSIYRKLDVHSRHQAVARARDLDLLSSV